MLVGEAVPALELLMGLFGTVPEPFVFKTSETGFLLNRKCYFEIILSK